MRILHTADLHIGKRLEGKSRLAEQVAVLGEIADIAKSNRVDVLLIAGDVFDVATPAPEAKKEFYKFAIDCAQFCKVIAIAGNHDNPDDFTAPRVLASAANIELIGTAQTLTVTIGGEKLNIVAVPYPDDSRLKSTVRDDETFALRIDEHIKKYTEIFKAGENNILLSHLFMTGAAEAGDENTLGPAKMLPTSILPDNAYCALGHIHKPSVCSHSKNAYYSGSPLNYHFEGDPDAQKSVIVFDISGGQMGEIKRLPLSSGKKLVTFSVSSTEDALKVLSENQDALVKLRYQSALPPAAGDTRKMRAMPNLVKLEFNINRSVEKKEETKKAKSDDQLFTMYYNQINGENPPDALRNAFAEIMSEVKR